jgi:hypothetical protein
MQPRKAFSRFPITKFAIRNLQFAMPYLLPNRSAPPPLAS